MSDLWEDIRTAVMAHMDWEHSDGSDADDATRDVLRALDGVTPEAISAALAAHPEPARLSIEEMSQLLVRRYQSFKEQAKAHAARFPSES